MSVSFAGGHAAAYSIRYPAPPRPESFVRFAARLALDGVAGLASALAGTWRTQRDLTSLQFADDRMLRDIGLTRDELVGTLSSPRWSHEGASMRSRESAVNAAGGH